MKLLYKHGVKQPEKLIEELGFPIDGILNRRVFSHSILTRSRAEKLESSVTYILAISCLEEVKHLRAVESGYRQEIDRVKQECGYLENVNKSLQENLYGFEEKLLTSKKQVLDAKRELGLGKEKIRMLEAEVARLKANKVHLFQSPEQDTRLAELTELKRELENEIEEMRQSRQLNEQFAKKVDQLASTSDKIHFELFRKDETRQAIRAAVASVKKAKNKRLEAEIKTNSVLQASNVRLLGELKKMENEVGSLQLQLDEMEREKLHKATILADALEKNADLTIELEKTRSALEHEMRFGDLQKREKSVLEVTLARLAMKRDCEDNADSLVNGETSASTMHELQKNVEAVELSLKEMEEALSKRVAEYNKLSAKTVALKIAEEKIQSAKDTKNVFCQTETDETYLLNNTKSAIIENQKLRADVTALLESQHVLQATLPSSRPFKTNIALPNKGTLNPIYTPEKEVTRKIDASESQVIDSDTSELIYIINSKYPQSNTEVSNSDHQQTASLKTVQKELADRECTIANLQAQLLKSVPLEQHQNVLQCLKRAEARSSPDDCLSGSRGHDCKVLLDQVRIQQKTIEYLQMQLTKTPRVIIKSRPAQIPIANLETTANETDDFKQSAHDKTELSLLKADNHHLNKALRSANVRCAKLLEQLQTLRVQAKLNPPMEQRPHYQ